MALKVLNKLWHTYKHENRRCEVWTDQKGEWVTRHFENKDCFNLWIKDVTHTGHNEIWAENAAENWVMGINS